MPIERPASARSASPRVPGPGSTSDQPTRRPAAAVDGDARQLQHAMADDEPQQVAAIARAGREPRDRPEQDPVGREHVARQQAEREAARVRQERDLDVVHEDADRDARMLTRAVEHESVVLGLGHAAQRARHEPARCRRVAERPQAGQDSGYEHQQPGGDQRLGPFGHRPPVAVCQVRAQRPGPRPRAVHERAGAQDERLQPARNGVVAEATPGIGEVGRGLAVARSQAQHVCGGQAPRPRQRRKLVPGGPASSRKRVRMHARRCSRSSAAYFGVRPRNTARQQTRA